MLIAQITDLHVVGKDQLCQERVATNTQLQEVVAHINGLDPCPDVVLATGDLTDHGTVEEYDALREILADLHPPLYLIPGNHDHRDIFLEAFADHAYLPQPGSPFAHYVLEEYPVRLVEHFVNTYQVILAFPDDETSVVVRICRCRVGQSTCKGLTKRTTRCLFRKSYATRTSCSRKRASSPHALVPWIPACAGMTRGHKRLAVYL